jgi:type VI secretion system protein ImpL
MGFLQQVPQLKYALGLTSLMSFYGIVGLIVWLIPGGTSFGMTEKVVTIALILLTMPIVLIIGFVASRRARKKEEREKAEKEAKAAEAGGADSSAPKLNKVAAPDDISQAAEETVQFLKSSNLGSGKDAVYELPWYLVIGSPKSGKTSLSLASGLNFQTLPSQRQSELKFVRPTRNVDWRVTSDAVFLDTAGRYQLEGGDEEEWSGLVETMKKYRPNRPLDGMLVSVNVERILHSDDNEIEQIAKVLRARIDEVTQRTKIRYPIYLIFTHADSIEGFRDSFSNSQKEGKNLVWGATIPLEKSENAHTLFDGEFDLLQTSIMKRRLMRLSAPFPPVRQLKIFNFPLHFGSSRKKIGHFVTNLFRPNPFSENPFLRGFYFTAVPVNRGKVDGGQTLTNVGQTVGLSYFTEKLFRDVILRDKDLVATFQAQQVRPPIMGWLLTFLGAFLAFAFLAGAAYSLYLNKVLVETASKHGTDVLSMTRTEKDNPLTKNPEQTKDELDKIERLRESLVELDKNEKSWVPHLKWFGLYSGNRIYREKLLPIYYNAIEQRFKKPVLKRLEEDLRKFSANQGQIDEATLEKNYIYLKAYLMFSGQFAKQSEATFLTTKLEEIWLAEGKVPEGYEIIARQQLEFYANQIDRFDERSLLKPEYLLSEHFPRINLEETNTKGLIEATRKKLQAYPPEFRYYNQVITRISQERKEQAVSAEKVLAGNSQGALSSTYTVPAAYTYDAYHTDFKAALAKAQEELSKDDWVIGGKAENQPVDLKKIENKYFNDYTDNWQKFIRGLSIPKFNSKDEAANAMSAFTGENSPMKIVLEEVSKQTNLSAEKPLTCCSLNYFYSFFSRKSATEKKTPTTVEQAFNPLFSFTASKGDKDQSQVSQYGNEMTKVSLALSSNDFNEKAAADELANQKGSFYDALNTAEGKVKTKAEGFKGTSAGQDIGELLKRPLNNVRMWLGGEIEQTVGKMWVDQILPAARKAEKGYPFDNEGEADLNELTKYLAPGTGIFSKFFDERLKKYFEEANGQWRPRENSEVKFDENFVRYVNSALRLREALFGKNPTPSFGYEFKLQKMSDAIIEVTIDGQKIDSNGTGSTKFTFPASSGETGAFMNFSSTAETSSTSGSAPTPPPATPSANSNSGNVNVSSTPTPSKPKPTPSSSSSSPTSLKEPGTWGLFRFFEKGGGTANKNAAGEYVLTYKLGGKSVTATIKPPANGDLFDRNFFTSARAPEKMLRQ